MEPAGELEKPDVPRSRPPRARLFGAVFLLVFASGCLYAFLQEETWRSTATVMMGAPDTPGESVEGAEAWTVASLSRRLLGSEVFVALTRRLFEEQGIQIPPSELGGMLRVNPVADTNLVELSAEGSDRAVLPAVVDGWLEAYLGVRAEDAASQRVETPRPVDREQTALQSRLQQARDALNAYRREHDILSGRSDESAAQAQLDVLEREFNEAIAEEVRAAAYLERLKLEARRGERFVPEGRQREVQTLERELQKLQAEMVELETRYTQQYIQKNLQLRAKVERIDELQRELERIYAGARETELVGARQAHATAKQALQDARGALSRYRESMADFTRIYETHDALAADVARLEAMNRDARPAEIEVADYELDKYPEIAVIQRPQGLSERIGPDYVRLLGGSFGLALVLGLLSVLLWSFPARRAPGPTSLAAQGVPPERPAVPPGRPVTRDTLGHEERMEMARMLTRREPRPDKHTGND